MKRDKPAKQGGIKAKNESNKGDIKGTSDNNLTSSRARYPFGALLPTAPKRITEFRQARAFLSNRDNLKEEAQAELARHVNRIHKLFPELLKEEIETDAMNILGIVNLFPFAFDDEIEKARLSFFNLWLRIDQAVQLGYKLESVTLNLRKGKKTEHFKIKAHQRRLTVNFEKYKNINGKPNKYTHVESEGRIFKAIGKAYDEIVSMHVIHERRQKEIYGPMNNVQSLKLTIITELVNARGGCKLIESLMALRKKDRLSEYFQELFKGLAPEVFLRLPDLKEFFKNHLKKLFGRISTIEKAIRKGQAKIQYDKNGRIERIEYLDNGTIRVIGDSVAIIKGKKRRIQYSS